MVHAWRVFDWVLLYFWIGASLVIGILLARGFYRLVRCCRRSSIIVDALHDRVTR